MTKLLLANISYRDHVTNEGEQLQAGLAAAGWVLAGRGYSPRTKPFMETHDSTDVPELLAHHQPGIVFVSDRRDWDRDLPGSFGRTDLHFVNIESLKDCGATIVMPLKDAGSSSETQRRWAESIGCHALVHYYHRQSILSAQCSPWAGEHHLIRTYHSVDADLCASIPLDQPRTRGLVSGAANGHVYPLRHRAAIHADRLGLEVLPHPGYGNTGCHTGDYLRTLARHRVHVACASRWGFALRKLVESVAMGCTPITDLPTYDPLPEIDAALIRVPTDCTVNQLADAIDLADGEWNLERANYFAECARHFYDWRKIGARLDAAIMNQKMTHVRTH